MTSDDTWRVTIDSPGDRQTLAALVAECRHRLAAGLDEETIAGICERVWELGTLVGGRRATATRIIIEPSRAVASPLASITAAGLRIEGLAPSHALAG